MAPSHSAYFIPEPSRWPVVGSIALFLAFAGAAFMLNGASPGDVVFIIGMLVLVYMFYGWFEVMFFAAFFGALYYARVYSVPWLGGSGTGLATNEFLWSQFEASWPMQVIPDPAKYLQYKEVVPAWDVPAVNTLILLSSGVTVTFAHWALKKGQRQALCWWLAATVALGFYFVYLQAGEYAHAYHDLDLTMNSGIYGSTFYMLTGFHGFHVTMGATMLLLILLRAMKGHFTEENHFAFEGVAWYWHFVDVVWLGLFIFVYWI